jgi:hypothetical protein
LTSTFGWLDYSDADRRRMLEVVGLFREKGTLDELGIGSIRDTFADLFCPGTSTIETRARCGGSVLSIGSPGERRRMRDRPNQRRAADANAASGVCDRPAHRAGTRDPRADG